MSPQETRWSETHRRVPGGGSRGMERRQSRAGRVNWGKLMAVRVHHTWKGGGVGSDGRSFGLQAALGRPWQAGRELLSSCPQVPPWAEAAQPQDTLPVQPLAESSVEGARPLCQLRGGPEARATGAPHGICSRVSEPCISPAAPRGSA